MIHCLSLLPITNVNTLSVALSANKNDSAFCTYRVRRSHVLYSENMKLTEW